MAASIEAVDGDTETRIGFGVPNGSVLASSVERGLQKELLEMDMISPWMPLERLGPHK